MECTNILDSYEDADGKKIKLFVEPHWNNTDNLVVLTISPSGKLVDEDTEPEEGSITITVLGKELKKAIDNCHNCYKYA